MKTYGISWYHIDEYLWDTQKSMWKKVCMAESTQAMNALRWYIDTGRASSAFLKKMIQVKPYVLGRYLLKIQNNSDERIIELIKQKIGY